MDGGGAHRTTGAHGRSVPRAARSLRRPARRRHLALVGAAVAFGVAGCGGGGDDGSSATQTGLSPGDARAADRSAEASLVSLAASMEDCFRGARTYARCTTNAELGATDALLTASRPGVGEAAISRASATGYRILAVSLSGGRFAITRQGARVTRSCVARTPLAKAGGGCRGNAW